MPFSVADFSPLLDSYYELYPKNKDAVKYLFFDEVQNIENWEMAVRRIYDKEKVRMFITGSSSKLLSREIASSLRGRTISYEMLPFSFEEVLSANGINASTETAYSKDRFEIKRLLDDYIKFGGFPRVVFEKSEITRIRILQEYLNTLLARDILERFSIRNKVLIREIIRFSISNATKLISVSNLYKTYKQKGAITKRTAINYVSILEEVMLIFLVPKFSVSLKAQMRNPDKEYLIDNGLRTASGFYISEGKGIMMENAVFLHLRELHNKDPMLEIFYWDNPNNSADFILKRGKKPVAVIQTTYASSREKIKQGEIDGVLSAGKELNCNNLLIITWDYELLQKVDSKKIKFIPLWKWLLDIDNSPSSIS